jgi:hypothetical protein
MFNKIIALLVLFNLTACSVFMAASSTDELKLSEIRVGALRTDIEKHLGKPISNYRKGTGDVATYMVLTGDKGDYRRAATYAVLDGLTLGLAEFITFPTEALQGDQNIFEITYSNQKRATSIKYKKKEAPVANPSEVIEKKFQNNKEQRA